MLHSSDEEGWCAERRGGLTRRCCDAIDNQSARDFFAASKAPCFQTRGKAFMLVQFHRCRGRRRARNVGHAGYRSLYGVI